MQLVTGHENQRQIRENFAQASGDKFGFARVAIFTTVTSAPFFSSSTFCPPAELALALRADLGRDTSRPDVFNSENTFAFITEVPASKTEAVLQADNRAADLILEESPKGIGTDSSRKSAPSIHRWPPR